MHNKIWCWCASISCSRLTLFLSFKAQIEASVDLTLYEKSILTFLLSSTEKSQQVFYKPLRCVSLYNLSLTRRCVIKISCSNERPLMFNSQPTTDDGGWLSAQAKRDEQKKLDIYINSYQFLSAPAHCWKCVTTCPTFIFPLFFLPSPNRYMG